MKNDSSRILVVGATGRQGGATARHLLKNGWKVRGMTRDRTKPGAKALEGLGAEIVEADLEDRRSLESAMDGVYGVFGVLTPYEKGVDSEERQGKNLVDSAQRAGVRHFVYSSVGGAERNTGIPHFESKWHIENHLEASGLPFTVLRPVFLMENFQFPMNKAAILSGRLESVLGPETPQQMLAADDVGRFAAIAFQDRETWQGRALEIAGDQKTMPQVAQAFSKVLGRPVSYMKIDPEAIQNPDRRAMFEWFQKAGYQADIPYLRRLCPGILTLEDWLNVSGWKGQ